MLTLQRIKISPSVDDIILQAQSCIIFCAIVSAVTAIQTIAVEAF